MACRFYYFDDLSAKSKQNFYNFNWLKSILMIEMELWKVVLVINFFIIMFWKRNW